METYLDEAIIKKREEQKRKKYSSLEKGYYVAGKILQFGEAEILGGFRIYLPDNMGTMPEEIARIKYPSEFRPPMILTTVDLSVNMGFNLFERQMEAGETEDMAKRMEAAIEREHPDYRFYGCKEMEKVAGHRFFFRSHGMDSDLYNMMLAVSLEKNLILANFICPYKDYKHWEKAVVLMWDTIRPARKKGEKAGRFLVQYEETDWQFAKRLAGYAGTVVIPEYIVPGPKMYFGYRDISVNEKIAADSYRLIQRNQGNTSREYEIVSREVYGLGDLVMFENREWVIGKAASSLKGQELEHVYTLLAKKDGLASVQCNGRIRGMSLKANVADVAGTKVQIGIQGDENKDRSGYRWFDFATVYSSPDGTGWYCMPEIGDEVRVAFPDGEEGNAYVSSCVHLEADGRTNPEEKSWKNKQGKEILFTPGALILRNNQGMSVELSDEQGIRIVSDKEIALCASGNISMNSQSEGIHMSASDSMVISQGGASISMKDAIRIGGGKIYMN